ncbi:MAG: ABC transporter substrate-binding protein [Clostridiales bacterium]|nr:ABC transporter substrate-binding protein [Clostridiales bacterium]
MKKLKSLFCILLVLLLTVSIVGCGGSGTSTDTPSGSSSGTPSQSQSPSGSPSGTTAGGSTSGVATHSLDDFVSYKVGVTQWLGRFMQGLSPTESWLACDGVYDSILKVDPATKTIISDCLEDWYYEDEVTFIMKLKENVYFSNGAHATAEDLLYSYTAILDRNSTQENSLGPIIWEECVILDEYTVRFKWERPWRVMENVMVYLLCKEWSLSLADGWEDMAWYYPVGSGQYEVTQFASEDIIIIRARDNYWNEAEIGPVYVDEWIIQFYRDPATMYMDLEVNELQLAMVAATDYSRFVNQGGEEGLDVFLLPTGSVMFFSFGFHDRSEWEDKRLREAVAIGVDWDLLGEVTFQEQFSPATSILPERNPFHIQPGKYEYNPERAKQLLIEAGYGPDNPLKLHTTKGDSPMYKSLCENIQFQLGQIGIEVELTFMDTASAIQIWNTGGGNDFFFWYRITGSATGDAWEILSGTTLESGSTVTRVYDPYFRELWFGMAYNTDPAIYGPIIEEIQQYCFDEIIYVPFAEHTISIGYRTEVFSEEQLRKYCYGINMYQLGRLGSLSAWEQ